MTTEANIADIDMASLSIVDGQESLVKLTEKDQTVMRSLPNKECKWIRESGDKKGNPWTDAFC